MGIKKESVIKENELLEKWGILLGTKQNRNFSKLSLLVRIESYAIILSNSFEPGLKIKFITTKILMK